MSKMKWERVNSHGMQSGEYRVGKVFLDGCTLYQLWYRYELIKTCNDFDECKEEAKKHDNSKSNGR